MKITMNFLSKLAFCTFLILSCTNSISQKKVKTDDRPNIMIILADDMGYSDIGCYGGEIETPNIDRLAKNGLRFSQFYNASRCCPTRASLLTGLYSHQAGVGTMSFDQGAPAYRGYLTSNTITIAELLKEAGYSTGMVGKWHVANTRVKETKDKQLDWLNHQAEYPEFAPLEQYPTSRGFEKFYGTIWGVVNFFDPFSLVNGTQPVKEVPRDYYYTDAINDTASSYIRQFSEKNQPFFLYVAHTAPHWPLHALPGEIKKYGEVYKTGWDAIRETRYKKMIIEGIFPGDKNILSPRWDMKTTWEVNPHKNWDAYAMAVRAAMIDRMDQGIGRMIKTLESTGELDNTLIFFLSDNGSSSDDAQNYEPGLDRPGETRNGEAIIYPRDKKVLPGGETSFASTDKMWGNVANTPFRYWKVNPYEGGICTPMIAHWPRGINAKKGSITSQVGHVMDFMATASKLAGIKYPKTYKGHLLTPVEGISLLPILQNKTRKGHTYLYFEHLNGRAVRYGDWKLVSLNQKAPWELYNLKEDRTEMNNLADQYPDLVEKLKSSWIRWANDNHVLPKPSPAQ